MIRIESARFNGTNAPISTVYISNVMRDGQAISSQDALGYPMVGGEILNARVEGNSIVCNTACAFAHPGNYSFDVSAANAVTQKVNINIPARKKGLFGCGGVTTGTPVTLNLKFDATS
ncbi:hypothetical protein Dalu01_00365 [Deinococcus aluminii]|uniref:DUF4402 domain-containing protein n=2 Tax=Deinococcus aluminii TaxID=1656885 RepID=A0ABP9XAU0_9DEIO